MAALCGSRISKLRGGAAIRCSALVSCPAVPHMTNARTEKKGKYHISSHRVKPAEIESHIGQRQLRKPRKLKDDK